MDEQNLSVINSLLPVLTQGNTGVFVYNSVTGHVNFKNDFFTLLGLTECEPKCTSLNQLRAMIDAADTVAFDRAFARALTGEIASETYCIRASENSTAVLYTTFMPCTGGVVACTVNKDVPLQLMRLEKQYQTVVNSLFPSFIFVFDENFFFVEIIMPAGLRLFHNNDELIGTDARNVYSPEVSELFIANIHECLKTNHWREIEYDLDLFGTRYFYQARIVPVDGNKVLCLIQDIGDRVRRMEEMLVQRQRAEESDRMKSAFLANISHEIRTPLHAITAFSEFIINEESDEEKAKYIDIIRSNTDMLLRIVDDLIDLSRMEAGMGEFEFKDIDVVELVKEVATFHIPAMSHRVQLLTKVPDRAISVPTDVNRLRQVLYNFMSNASKHTYEGSITIQLEEGDEYLTFSVTDTGSGIPADKLGRIFNRFEKANTFVQGTGLGLAICKSIVERLGGSIAVKSEEEVGSTFSFTIPYRNTPVHLTTGSVRELAANQRKKILVAETSETDLQFIREILAHKFDIVATSDNEKTINSFILDKPNLVLLNMNMTGKIDIARRIRAISTSIPIIAMTTSDFYHDQRVAIENGCTDVIAKPFSPTKLEEVVMAFIV